MIFIICIIIGILGIIGTLWLTKKRPAEPDGAHEPSWIAVPPDVLEFHLSIFIGDKLRKLTKNFVAWLLQVYRSLARKITIKQVVKKQVREFLSEPQSEIPREPSEFWAQVRESSSDTSLSDTHEEELPLQ